MDAIAGFGTRLKAAMRKKGWNQRVLSEMSGVHKQQIYKLLAGERQDPRTSTLVCLARALEVSLDELAGSTQEPPQP